MNPWIVRHCLSPLHERLLGRSTFARLRELEASQWWPPLVLRELQRHKLRHLFRLAATHCPYFRDVFAARGLQHERDDPFDLLPDLPLLDRATLRDRRSDLTCTCVPGGPIPFNTGGSTGEPLNFYFDRRRIAYDKAARMRTHHWFGAKPGDREVYLWGAPAEFRRQDRLRQWRDRLTNELLLSAFNMSPVTMRDYLRQIESYNPVSLFGYPGSIALLCDFAQAEGITIRPPALQVVFVTGEVLEPRQRETIEGYFQVPVANGYGSRDGGFVAHQCPRGAMHVTSENFVMEIVDGHGQILPQGEFGEIVITHLDCHAMPFIRYRTGDVGRLLGGMCACGRGLQLMDVVAGRSTDHLVATDGTLKHALSLIYVMRRMDNVRHFQIHQDRQRGVEIRMVTSKPLSLAERQEIEHGVRLQLGQDVRLRLTLVDRIEPLPSGKHRYVVSEAFDDANRWRSGAQPSAVLQPATC
jgi:phenylacetate-CoA ligase